MNFFLKSQNNLSPVVTINPKPELVIKSKLVSTSNRPKDLPPLEIGTKVFINLCHDEQVPQPDINFDPAIVYPLIINDQWEIPIITSSMRQDKDKKGALCYVWDCCINTKCAQWIRKEYQLREIVVEWCRESCDLAELLEISRDGISFPKMKSKGPIPPLEMLSEELNSDYKKEMAKMVEEGRDEPDNLIRMRRSLMDDEEKAALEEKELPPLFPTNNGKPASNEGKPLIEEIDELSIEEKGSRPLKEVDFKVVMGKADSPHKLRIEITSDLESGSDYDVTYDATHNELVVKNVNLEKFKEKTLNIPLPNIFDSRDTVESHIQCLFIKTEKKLSIKI
ncbi:hypothetical protein ZYGR_0AI05820 [Zygosaccharomyces rouxii]|uniref:Protein interacting with Hsp90 1 n=1 Tax=Zygosaccharomyces rouxii TaxID=4956 RepID=A0A1Q3ACC1_ZYGRO|nr:hypothetical protein ZYGR_0AI05820 [Zygosaccharomyces rouxii]